jgi:hypothetical protein
MGYELNRIMKQYGVSTPGMAPYTGSSFTIPTAPTGSRPAGTGSDADLTASQESYDQQLADFKAYTEDPYTYKASKGFVGRNVNNFTAPTRPLGDRPTSTSVSNQAAYDKQLADFNAYKANPASFNEQIRKYDLDQKSYDEYKNTYQSRLQNTPMYAQGQFQKDQPQMTFQTGQPLVGNTLTPEIATSLMQTSMTPAGVPTSEFNKYGGYDKVKALYDTGGGSYAKPTQQTAYTVADLYRMYLGREPEAGIYGAAHASTRPNFINEAQPELSTKPTFGNQNLMNATGSYYGNQLKNPIYAAEGGSVHDLTDKYALGGQVKTHYQTAGAVKLPSGYGSVEEEEDFKNRFFTPSPEVVSNPIKMGNIPAAVTNDLPVVATAPKSILTEIAVNNAKNVSEPIDVAPVAVAPVAPVAPKAAVPFGGERMGNIQALLDAYGPKDSAYAADLKTARESAKAETDAFAKMLKTAMSSPEDAQSSKAEMYFRLASAFGAPTKTGQFSENLSMVGKELGEYAKNKRTSAKEKLALALEAQKMKMTSAKEELNTLRALTGEEMKDKRAIATELLKNYIKSGEPQSAAGKQALDEGLVPGTPAYQARVEVIGNMNIEAKMAQINSALSGVSTAAANLAVTQARLDLDRDKLEQQKSQQAKLTGPEMKLKVDAEDTLAQTDQALANLKKAYALNPNTFDGSLLDVAQRKLYESSGSKDPKVVATRELENLLKKASLSQLKATFPGAISNDERAALDAVQGLDAKSKDERAVIMKNAFTALKSVSERHRRRLLEINQGVYRDTAAPIEEGDK